MKAFLLALTIVVLGCGVSFAGEPQTNLPPTIRLPPTSPQRWERTREPTQASTAQNPRTIRRRLNSLNERYSEQQHPASIAPAILARGVASAWIRRALNSFSGYPPEPRLLPQRHDPPWPALDRFIERSPRNAVITGKSDQLLDLSIRVVPKLY